MKAMLKLKLSEYKKTQCKKGKQHLLVSLFDLHMITRDCNQDQVSSKLDIHFFPHSNCADLKEHMQVIVSQWELGVKEPTVYEIMSKTFGVVEPKHHARAQERLKERADWQQWADEETKHIVGHNHGRAVRILKRDVPAETHG
jgi:hypothetical protein